MKYIIPLVLSLAACAFLAWVALGMIDLIHTMASIIEGGLSL